MSALLVLLAVAGSWEAYARLSGVEQFVLPAPSEIATALVDDRALLWSNFTVTAGEIAVGIGAAVALGLGCAIGLHFAPRAVRLKCRATASANPARSDTTIPPATSSAVTAKLSASSERSS